ncbi:MAG TPA: sigma factor-like helix-turn-helix DNA-binding protein [Solirubrobacterales bacterium]
MDLNPQLPSVALDSFGEGELADLDDRTVFILRMRSGMLDGERHTQNEVGEELGITKARVRVLEKEGLRVIRQVRESQRHPREEPVSVRYRWRLPMPVAMKRWRERHG